MKKLIFSVTVSLLLASSTLATNLTTLFKAEQVAAIEGYQSSLFLELPQFVSDLDSRTWSELALKSGSIESDKATNTVQTVNLTQDETDQLIVILDHMLTIEIEPGYLSTAISKPMALRLGLANTNY